MQRVPQHKLPDQVLHAHMSFLVPAKHLSDIHAINKNARHSKGRALLVDVGAVISGSGIGGPVVLHPNGPKVVLHHKYAGQLVQRGHIQALVELPCTHSANMLILQFSILAHTSSTQL